MVKSNPNSRFALYTLAQIRDSKDVILQTEDTKSNFTDGQKCYLCEVVAPFQYLNTRHKDDLVNEICLLNADKRKLEKKIARLEKRLANERNEG